MENQVVKFFQNHDQFAAFSGVKLEDAQPGYARATLEVARHHLNGVNMVQGGVIFTLTDFAFAAASNACGQVTVGIHADISYLKASKGKKLIAEAREVAASRKIVTYTVDVFDENANLVAQATHTGYRKEEKIKFE